MDHSDHVDLIRGGVDGGEWADLGSGEGAFTLALAELLGSAGRIHSVDKDRHALARQQELVGQRFPEADIGYLVADFRRPLNLPPLDGVLMANSLHFVRDKGPVLELLRAQIKPGGHLLLVEYGTDRGNLWVPHPLSYPTWERVAGDAGFVGTHLLATVPSRFLGQIYAALGTVPPPAGTVPDNRERQ
jgi:ubiquinone/menaquinone biosynthesis C-methylase UbiE